MPGSTHIAIVNWNTGDFLRDCVRSIAAADVDGVNLTAVTVVDNASTDGSAAGLDGDDIPLEVVHNTSNVGFAAACNQAVAGSEADYLLFLNPDTRLFADTLEIVTEFMDSERAARIGISGAQVLDLDDGPGLSCSRFPTLPVVFGKMTGLDRVLPGLFPSHHLTTDETRHSGIVEQVIGAFFLVRRELFTSLGGFDTRYFTYYEEVDFALRARDRGFHSYFLKEARVLHAEGVSSEQVLDLRLYHSLRSRLMFARLHWPRWQLPVLAALTLVVELPARLGRALVHRNGAELGATTSAYRRLIAHGWRAG
jgi:N-acetylglucosaminyl-diphospho-decaprenol L-rhamnosyltransferase